MFNIGGGEVLVILVVALIVLGPAKLPEAARQMGRVMSQFRRMSTDFQREMQQAMNDPVAKITDSADRVEGRPRAIEATPTTTPTPTPEADDAPVSTAEEAGMYDRAVGDEGTEAL